jgi:predicted metalloprotease with PDZ domain
VSATDGQGRALRVTRPDPYGWTVAGHDGTVRVRYTIFGDRADGTYLAVDRTHAHMNMPATFMFARGLEARPIRLTICAPDSTWTVATQLAAVEGDARTFTAPHLQYFFDSPTEVSDHETYAWPVTSGGRTQTVRLTLHHAGSKEEGARYAEKVKKVVAEQEGIFGELARYDFGTYTFLADYLPWDDGDGMEHRNSTVVISSGSLADNAMGLLGTVSHEFFHSWNVERIRPQSLEPFDFEAADMSGELWLAEGFTQYYGPLAIRRAGLTDDQQFVRTVAGTANAVINGPGRRYFSPVEMSQQAPFVDAARSIDPQNKANTFISYYTWGAGIALALDMELRTRGKTLDDFMRAMWAAYGRPQRNYAPVKRYTVDDARRVLGQVSGDAAWADGFFARYVTGREAPDYAALLARAGILLRPAAPNAAWMGDVRWADENGRVTLASSAIVGTPLYEAGMENGDRLVSVDGREVRSAQDVTAALAARKPGDRVPLVFESRGSTQNATVTLAASPRLEGVLFEDAGRPVTEEIRRFRAAWTASRAR